jgi:glycosyltransferase involved in cell wall biosynthesis
MSLTVNFIERKIADTQSIEGVFRQVSKGIDRNGIRSIFSKLPYSNSFFGLVRNLLQFRPMKADIYHITGHIHYVALILPGSRTVITIHDLGILRNRTGLRRWIIKKLYFDLPVKRAGFITVISEATKVDLIKVTGIDPSRVQVIENPLREGLAGSQKPDFNAALPRLLQVGTAKHKNLDNLVKAIRGLTCRLVIVGALDASQVELLNKSGTDFENFVDLGEQAMLEQYKNADMVVFCSEFEGFGLPIIEAQAMKTPVITSDLSPMKEVAGNGSLLVDPENISAIRNAIEKVIGDAPLRANLVEQGLENIKRFDADEIAGKYISVYKELIDRS